MAEIIVGELDPWLLTEAELNYELEIRKVKLSTRSQKDIDSKRKVLSSFVIKRDFDKLVDENFNLQVQTDFIKNSLTALNKMISDFTGIESDVMCRSLRARLISLFYRIKRFQIPVLEEEEYQDLVDDWNCQCMELNTTLLFKVSPHLKPGARYTNPTVIPITVPGVSNQAPMVVPVTVPIPSSTPVCKWGVTFSGDTSVKAFIERVCELARARCVSDDQLFRSGIDLFEGPALTWFRANRDSFCSWTDLVDRLLKDFLPSDYDEILLDQIKGRFQGKTESVNLYVASMQNLFSRLSVPPSLIDQLKIIRRNLLSRYVNALVLQDIKTMNELLNFCKLIDEASQTKTRYVQSSAANCLETDLIFRENCPSSSTGTRNNYRNSNPRNKIAVICHNCKKDGHLFKDCTEARKKFCFRCGTANMTVYTCTKCNPKN